MIEAVRLRIEPAMDGLGIEVPTPLTADEAVENFFDPDFCSSLDLFRKDKNWGKPEPVPPSAKIPIYLLFILFITCQQPILNLRISESTNFIFYLNNFVKKIQDS